MSAVTRRIALVTPFFGRDVHGRKERFAFNFATHLALEGVSLDVLTTAARADAPGENFYRSGVDNTEPFPIYRFRVGATDRAAYSAALLAARRGSDKAAPQALLDERVRSVELLAHIRTVADRYDAFLLLDLASPTTVAAAAEVAEHAIIVPLMDEEAVFRLPAIADAVEQARLILCTSEVEGALAAELFGPAVRPRVRVIGMAADPLPASDAAVARITRKYGAALILTAGEHAAEVFAALRSGGWSTRAIDSLDEGERAAYFTAAAAVAVARETGAFAPEVFESWAYGKPVLAAETVSGAAALVRQSGGGLVVAGGDWAGAAVALRDAKMVADLRAAAERFAAGSGGWPAVAKRAADAIDELDAIGGERSRTALLAQIGFLYPLVQRQRRTIEAMRISRFWRLREMWFAAKRRLGIGPAVDPVAIPSDDRGLALAAMGDPYQLVREQQKLRADDVDRIAAVQRFVPIKPLLAIEIDLRACTAAGLAGTLRSLREQLYPRWTAHVRIAPGDDEAQAAVMAAREGDERVVLVTGAGPDGGADFVGALDAYDRLEPHALFDCVLALQDGADVVYSDHDLLDERGVERRPAFKADWSPETLLTRDYVGKLCLVRCSLVERVGGVRDVFESARWYDALLRITEHTDAVVHVPRVLCHVDERNLSSVRDGALAVEAALARRGEPALIEVSPLGCDIRFGNAGERVCVIIPTRDRADLLGPCIRSIFERTEYEAFEVIVADNGSRETQTRELLEFWQQREPRRFKVLHDAAPFNYSRLNNAAAKATDAPYLVLLNNDTEVISGKWMTALLGEARRPRIGAAGALLLYDDGTVQHAGVILGILGLAGHAHRYLPSNVPGHLGSLQFDTNYLAVTGACMMVARSKYFAVGGLDESLAVSYNDVDFCLKLHAAGYRNVYVPAAKLYHYESKSRGADDTPGKVARAMQEVAVIRTRWPAFAKRDPYYNPNLTVDAEDFGLRL